METKDKIQIAALVLIAIFILVLIITLVIFVKNVDEIKSDPVHYAIGKDFYDSCSCYIGAEKFDFNKETVIQNWPS